jgi:hypothetical protein
METNMEAPLYTANGEKSGTVELPGAIFGVEPRKILVLKALKRHLVLPAPKPAGWCRVVEPNLGHRKEPVMPARGVDVPRCGPEVVSHLVRCLVPMQSRCQ